MRQLQIAIRILNNSYNHKKRIGSLQFCRRTHRADLRDIVKAPQPREGYARSGASGSDHTVHGPQIHVFGQSFVGIAGRVPDLVGDGTESAQFAVKEAIGLVVEEVHRDLKDRFCPFIIGQIQNSGEFDTKVLLEFPISLNGVAIATLGGHSCV